MKEILEQGLAIVAPHTASTAPTPRHDRHKEKREKKERKKVIVEDRGLGKSVNLDNIFSSMDKIAPIEKKKKKKKKKDKEKEEDSDDDLPAPVPAEKDEEPAPVLSKPESPKMPENTWSWTSRKEREERMRREGVDEEQEQA